MASTSAIEVGFPEIDIQTTVTVLLRRFHLGKIELPPEVELCPVGLEAEGWRVAAIRTLKEARERNRAAAALVVR
jgi:hypothetical protein